jgi:murein hydrolase activator
MNISPKTILTIILVTIITLAPTITFGSAVDQKKQELNQIQNQIQNIQGGLQQKQNEVRSLNDQIAFMNSQIKAVQDQIALIEGQIVSTNNEIQGISQQIDEVKKKLKDQQEVLREYVVEFYSSRNSSTLEMLASSGTFADYMDQVEYMESLQEKINKNVKTIQELQNNLDSKKANLEQQKSNLEELHAVQDQQKQSLEHQKAEKNDILEITKGEESRYQSMLQDYRSREASAQNEINKMVQELSRKRSISSNTNVSGYQSAGAIIGYQGNTGYSTGTHLHFTVFKNGVEVDPLPLLKNGTLAWPLQNPIITQYYGIPSWNAAYSFHNGIDMTAGYGAPIRMAAPGVVIKDAWMPNGYGHYKIVDHGNGLMTLYAHMQ